MQRRGRAGGCYAVLAMLVAGATGRVLDTGGRLPGVTEAAAVRGSGLAWLVALAGALLVGLLSATSWRRRRSVRALAGRVVAGQAVVFLAAEAAARASRGQGLLDPDGLLGAALQAALAIALLSVLAVSCVVLRAAAPLAVRDRPLRAVRARPLGVPPAKGVPQRRSARAPPVHSCTCAA